MRIFLSLYLLFAIEAHSACDFKSDVRGIVSLSGPVTVLIKELGLLQNKKLKGISVFNPIPEKEFQGRIYPGGVFFSHGALAELAGNIVFYDESRELNHVFAPRSSIISREIKTRGLTPFESVTLSVNKLREFLVDCEKEISQVEKKVKQLQDNILKKIPKGTWVVFYLGEFRGGRAPELVIVQDGVVKWLIQEKKIKTYPSELSYVNWSAKVMQSLPKNTLYVGVKDSAREMTKEIKKSPRGTTFIYPGSLVPGVTQLEAFLFWTEATF